jgi:hypothetical protein
MMAQEIDLSQGNLSLVNASAAKLSVATKEYNKQHAKLHTSKGLLRMIRWHERKEDILLYSGLGFFAACVLYIVMRRSLLFVPSMAWLRGAIGWVWSLGVSLWDVGQGDREAAVIDKAGDLPGRDADAGSSVQEL